MGGSGDDIEWKGAPCVWPSDCKRPGSNVSLLARNHKDIMLPSDTCSTLMNSLE